jgi:hypothetical protein
MFRALARRAKLVEDQCAQAANLLPISRKAARKKREKDLEEFIIHAGRSQATLNDVLPFPYKADGVGNDFIRQLLSTKGEDDTIVGIEVWRVLQEMRQSRFKRLYVAMKNHLLSWRLNLSGWRRNSISDYINQDWQRSSMKLLE